jgi:uncharacterized RmlC-like cupin family protein
MTISQCTFLTQTKYTNEISKGILGFAEMNVHVTTLGPCERADEHRHEEWITEVQDMGRKGI